MDIYIRLCTIDDLLTLRELSYRTYDETFRHLNTPENMEFYLKRAFNMEKMKEELANTASQFYFLYADGALSGYIKVNDYEAQSDINDPQSLEIERIYVESGHQGRGLGKVLIDKGIGLAIHMKKSYVWLGVWEKNYRAIEFYKSNGFRVIGTHSFFMGDEEQTDFLMRKDI